MTSSSAPKDAQPTAERLPWAPPRVRALPVSRTETGVSRTNYADVATYLS